MIILAFIGVILGLYTAIKLLGVAFAYISYGVDQLKRPMPKKRWVIEERKDPPIIIEEKEE